MSNKTSVILTIAAVLAIGLTGCGSTTDITSTASQLTRSNAADISQSDAMAIRSLNVDPNLDGLDLDDLDIAYETLDDGYATAALPNVLKCSNRIGMIRSVADGQFFLSTHEGFLFQKDVDLPVVGSSESKTLRLAKYLNKKVLIHGELGSGKMTAEAIMPVPDLGAITDVLSKGRIGGNACDSTTKAAVRDADVTVISIATKHIYRTHSDSKGNYHVSRLDAGSYSIQASKSGYASFSAITVSVAKRKRTEVNIGFNH